MENRYFNALKELIVSDEILKKIYQTSIERNTGVYVVGGFVRDVLLGRVKNDIDLSMKDDPIGFAKKFAQTTGSAFVVLDEERETARVITKRKEGLLEIDFCKFRGNTIEEDLALRDFTINSLAVDMKALFDGSNSVLKDTVLTDPFGGIKDIQDKVIRAISEKSLLDDPLRMMRVVRFKAELGFEPSAETLAMVKRNRSMLSEVAFERISDEFFKILSYSGAADNVTLMDETGLLNVIIPEVSGIKDVGQNKYHHLDVWGHSLECLKCFEEILANLSGMFPENESRLAGFLEEFVSGDRKTGTFLKFCLLVHDIGKGAVKKTDEDGKIIFYGHERTGSVMARKIARRLKLSSAEATLVTKMTMMHMRFGGLLNNENISDRALYRFFKELGVFGTGLLLISMADRSATRGELSREEDIQSHKKHVVSAINRFFEEREKVIPEKLISGTDLKVTFGLQEGREIGRILDEIKMAQVEGKIANREQALEFARNMLNWK